MTNNQIIWEQRCALAKQGQIGYTGREVKVPLEGGGEMVCREPEEIHTYATWKALGFQVKRGEKALAKIAIWKYATARRDAAEETDDQPEGRMFMKLAFFFGEAQVEKIA